MKQLDLFEPMMPDVPLKAASNLDESKLTKVYYTITEVAEMFQVNASLLRYWEKMFPVQLGHVRKNKKGDRFYNRQDISKLKLIFHLVKEKRMTLEGAKSYLKQLRKKPHTEQQLVEYLQKIRAFLVDLKRNIG